VSDRMTEAPVYRLDDYRPFDIGTPSRCYRCGGPDPRQSFGDGGYVWACTNCPHPSGE